MAEKSRAKMAMELRVETTHIETIKPSSPTPPNLKIFKLSLIDQIAPTVYVSLYFWYPNDVDPADNDHFAKAGETSHRLKKSLSETLSHFYPFAGRLSGSLIECNDEGVDYVETRVNCLLQDILKQPYEELVNKLLPVQMESSDAATRPLLLVKVNIFECGGKAIVVSISHKIADMSTLSIFIKSWAGVARGSSEVVLPEFVSASSLFPPVDLPFTASEMDLRGPKVAVRRLVFDASKISMLKAEAASTDVPQPTRVEAVAALIWKCAKAAATSNRDGFTKPSGLLQAVNLRKRMKPPLPDNSIGNLVFCFIAQTQAEDCETELQGLVKQLRDGIREFSENSVRKLQGSGAISAILETAKEVGNLSNTDGLDFYRSISWCGFELYGADFGWGKPRWVSVAAAAAPNMYFLMDTWDGEGIEAWVCLSEAEMAFFERNQEMLEFASVDPSVI